MQLDRAHVGIAAGHRRDRAGSAVIDLPGPHDLRRGDNRAERRRHILQREKSGVVRLGGKYAEQHHGDADCRRAVCIHHPALNSGRRVRAQRIQT